MVLYERECANLIWKANFNLISITELLMCFHIMFQTPFQHLKGQIIIVIFWVFRSFGQYIQCIKVMKYC